MAICEYFYSDNDEDCRDFTPKLEQYIKEWSQESGNPPLTLIKLNIDEFEFLSWNRVVKEVPQMELTHYYSYKSLLVGVPTEDELKEFLDKYYE